MPLRSFTHTPTDPAHTQHGNPPFLSYLDKEEEDCNVGEDDEADVCLGGGHLVARHHPGADRYLTTT